MPYAIRTREFSFQMDVDAAAPIPTGGWATADDLSLAWSVIGEPTFPSMLIEQITEQAGAPYEQALPGNLPVANRRAEWELAEWDERLFAVGGRPFEYLGAPDANGNITRTQGEPAFNFRAISRRLTDAQLLVTDFELQGGLDIPQPRGLTGGEYARLGCVVRDVQKFIVKRSRWTNPGTTLTFTTLVDIDLPAVKYEINNYDYWNGLKAAMRV